MSAVNPQSINRDKERLDENLNEALEESFPASDPPSLTRAPRDDARAMPRQTPAPPGAVLDKQDARQGATGQGVRYVLIAGLLLAIVAMVVLYFVWWK
jgi:hypothetical protein